MAPPVRRGARKPWTAPEPVFPRERWRPEPPDSVRNPTREHPRWRLVVFDQRWPWRATQGEAMADAVASRHARRDLEDRVTYLNGYAFLQQDPPPRRSTYR